MHPPEHGKFCPPPPGCRSMAPRKKDKGRQAARKQKRAGKDVLRELYKLCPEAGGEAGVKEDGKEMFIRSAKVFSLPESIGTLDGLQILNLSECPQLLELPDTIGGLKALTSLDLSGCASLTALPNAIGELGALTELHLNECSSITKLPGAIGELGALTTLYLRGCSSLAGLPAMMGELKALTYLNLSACSSLTTLPATIGELSALTTLTLYGCSKLAALPAAIGGLGALKQLWLRDCSSVTALPESIGKLGALTRLDLNECSSLTTLPDAIGELKSLTFLDLSGCASLTALPNAIGELGALTELSLNDCSSLTALPVAIGELGALTELWLTGCSSLVALPDAIGKLSALTLNVDEGSNLTMPPNAVHAMPGLTVGDSNSGLSKASPQATDADEAADEAVRDQPEEEHEAETERKILEFWEIEGSLSDAQRPLLRRLRRRVCDACGRQGTLEVERFPVCYCGAKRYCDESCQLVDWDRGHSTTCASGHTFPQNLLDSLGRSTFFGKDEIVRAMYERFPPPADRPRQLIVCVPYFELRRTGSESDSGAGEVGLSSIDRSAGHGSTVGECSAVTRRSTTFGGDFGGAAEASLALARRAAPRSFPASLAWVCIEIETDGSWSPGKRGGAPTSAFALAHPSDAKTTRRSPEPIGTVSSGPMSTEHDTGPSRSGSSL